MLKFTWYIRFRYTFQFYEQGFIGLDFLSPPSPLFPQANSTKKLEKAELESGLDWLSDFLSFCLFWALMICFFLQLMHAESHIIVSFQPSYNFSYHVVDAC